MVLNILKVLWNLKFEIQSLDVVEKLRENVSECWQLALTAHYQ